MRSNKKSFKYFSIGLLMVIVISNTPPVAFFIAPYYHYQTADGKFQFTEEPGKGMDYEVLKIRYERYLAEHPTSQDRTLFRTFKVKPWQFWQWWEMVVRYERFRLPYVETMENESS